jgi:hypothetical protein
MTCGIINIGENMIQVLDTKCPPNGSSIRASCCHDVTNKLALIITTKDTTIDYGRECFVNCVCYQVVCFPCFLNNLKWGLILFTKKAEKKWMHKK